MDMRTGIGVVLAALLGMAPAWGHDEHHTGTPEHGGRQQQAWGIPGDAKRARTIEVAMGDDMRFTPDRIEVRAGETIRLLVRNRGQVPHEMVIGTEAELAAHAASMKGSPGMEHEDPNMLRVKPGGQGELVWNFNRPGAFRFACLLPGHFEAGMKGTIVVVPKAKKA
jgi:uncharacterized cupredoxin-like copper-binding protein